MGPSTWYSQPALMSLHQAAWAPVVCLTSRTISSYLYVPPRRLPASTSKVSGYAGHLWTSALPIRNSTTTLARIRTTTWGIFIRFRFHIAYKWISPPHSIGLCSAFDKHTSQFPVELHSRHRHHILSIHPLTYTIGRYRSGRVS